MKKVLKIALLIFLVLLPFCFPFTGYRGGHLVPAENNASYMEYYTLIFIVFAYTSLPYWCFVGWLFRHFGVGFKASFFLGNLPVFFNTIGQFIYYVFLDIAGKSHPMFEYLIGSHIDKFDVFSSVFHFQSYVIQIIFSASFLLGAFALGHFIEETRIKDKLAEQQEALEPQDTQRR